MIACRRTRAPLQRVRVAAKGQRVEAKVAGQVREVTILHFN